MIKYFQIQERKIPVTVSLKGPKGIREFNFIVDTGATQSIIDGELLKSIGYSRSDIDYTKKVRDFGGKAIKIDFVKIASIKSLGLKRDNFLMGMHEFSVYTFYDGLLGIDFFLNHKLCVDFRKGIIELDQ